MAFLPTPVRRVSVLDEPVPDARATALAAEIDGPVGRVIVVHHRGAFQLDGELVRERQAVATARFVERLLAAADPVPVVLVGDVNAGPDAASNRFLEGRQFSPTDPLVRDGEMPLERGRRIDHVMIRSGAHGPLLDVADCRLVLDRPSEGTWASDHFGVLAEVRRPPHPPGSRRPPAAPS